MNILRYTIIFFNRWRWVFSCRLRSNYPQRQFRYP